MILSSKTSSLLCPSSSRRSLIWRSTNPSNGVRRVDKTVVCAAQSDRPSSSNWFTNFMANLGFPQPSDNLQVATEGKPDVKDAVLVFGGTGKTGRYLLQKLLDSGRVVKAAVRSAEKLKDLRQKNLVEVEGVDMKFAETLNENLFDGVSQVVICTGPVLMPNPAGVGPPMISKEDTSEAVDKNGVKNVVEACEKFLARNEAVVFGEGIDLGKDIESWECIPDYNDGEKSSSTGRKVGEDEIVIEGETIGTTERFGYVQHRNPKVELDLTGADGVHFRVKGDGKKYFVVLKSEDQETSEIPKSFSAPFKTIDGEWTDVYIPLHEFYEVTASVTGPVPVQLTPRRITKLGFLASRYDFNVLPNNDFQLGPFSLTIKAQLRPYQAPKPQVILVSAGGVERNARIGEDQEKRDKDIPIIRMNPGGVLGHKYDGENTLRASSLLYTIIRPHGMISEDELAAGDLPPALLELNQGDEFSGTTKRSEIAELIVQCTRRPEAVCKTFEVRRSPAPEAQDRPMTDAAYLKALLGLVRDEDRTKYGISPFPRPLPAPVIPEMTEERLEDIAKQQKALQEERKDLIKAK